jgi:threonine dehydratase
LPPETIATTVWPGSTPALPASSAATGAAASTAALLSGAVQIEPGQTVVAVVSGGNIAAKQAAAILDS